jgi:GTP-binding protein
MLVDEIVLKVEAGHGGPGKVSFRRPPNKGPDGGNGGNGGNIWIQPTSDIMSLGRFSRNTTIKADNGEIGQRSTKFGHNALDKTIELPIGSLIECLEDGKIIEITPQTGRFIIATGGLGGRGNHEFRSPTNTTPITAEPGERGEKKTLKILLKLIADYGLIGLPNAGKSSLLNELTRANVRVANYPFTTLEPNLGVCGKKILADIPGLIEGAASGKGLGIKFLKHIEKTSTLLHCIAADSDDPKGEYKTIWKEMNAFDKTLKYKQEIILLTKSDTVDKKELVTLTKLFKGKKVLPVSIHDYDSIENLKKIIVNRES